MRTYLVTGEGETLDALAEQGLLDITRRGRYAPIATIETELELEELQEMLPDYEVQQPKEYRIQDDR